MMISYANNPTIYRYAIKIIRASSTSAIPQGSQPQKKRLQIAPLPPTIKISHGKYYPGNDYDDFKCIRAERIPELGMMSYLFRHNVSGTELLYLDRNDPNNLFSINVRTIPSDSRGLAHILEHTTLSGSQKYPIRAPFFKMINRTVSSFMNALTSYDYTMFPFSSMNEVDYRNLQRLYLDSVYRPKLDYMDFLQEGWRFEHKKLRNKNSDLVIKGVVYNEMIGILSSTSSFMRNNLLLNLLPDHVYGHFSGGNPLEIPYATYEDLVAFHQKFYHPSNSRIFCYGNFDLNETLKYINSTYLWQYEGIDTDYSMVPKQPRWFNPRYVHLNSNYDNLGAPFHNQSQIAIALLMTDVTNVYENFVLSVVAQLLLRGPNAPLYRTLIEPSFSGGYNSVTGYNAQVKDTFFCVGLQDVKIEDFPRVEEIFENTIYEVVDNGFDRSHVECVLQSIKLQLAHQHPRYGLKLLFANTPVWNHNGDVIENLKVYNHIRLLQENLKYNPKYLHDKVLQYFVNNRHRLTLTMSPDHAYEANFRHAEEAMLISKKAGLTTKECKQIYKNGIRLEHLQCAPTNDEVLPSLDLSDVETPPKSYPNNLVKIDDIPTQICTIESNKLSYLKCLFECNQLHKDEILLIPLFCKVVKDMRTKKYDYWNFDKIVKLKTCGFTLTHHCAENIFDNKTHEVGLLLSVFAFNHYTESMFDLTLELCRNFQFDNLERLDMLVNNYMSSLTRAIPANAHLYAMQSCSGCVTDAARLNAFLQSVEHIQMMKYLVNNYTIVDIQKKLTNLGKKLFNAKAMRVAVNTSQKHLPKFTSKYATFLHNMPMNEYRKKIIKVNLLKPSFVHFIMNFPVNHCAKSFYTVPYTHEDHPALRVLANLLTAKYLLPVVRERNNAYVSGAKIGLNGIFSFYTYRDPNTLKTFETFDESYNWFRENEEDITEQSILEAKLLGLQELDAPVAPGDLGRNQFLYNLSQEVFRKYRHRMLKVTVTEVKDMMEKYFRDDPKHFAKYILGPENDEISKKSKWKIVG